MILSWQKQLSVLLAEKNRSELTDLVPWAAVSLTVVLIIWEPLLGHVPFPTLYEDRSKHSHVYFKKKLGRLCWVKHNKMFEVKEMQLF